MCRRRDVVAIVLLGRDEPAHLLRETGVGDAQHHLDIDEQAAHVEIGGPDIDDIVDDDQLHVQLAWLIFPDLRAFAEQIAIEQARGADRRRIVGLRRHDEARPAVPRDAAEPPQHPLTGRKIGHYHIELACAGQVGAHRAGPGRQPLGRAADQPGDRPRVDRPFADQAAKHQQLAVVVHRKVVDFRKPGDHARHRRAANDDAQIEPAIARLCPKIGGRNVETPGHRHRLVDQQQFLVIADQIARPPVPREKGHAAAGAAQRRKNAVGNIR